MGYNATVVVYLDAIDQIREDKDFGKKFADAILKKANRDPQGDTQVRFNASSKRGSSSAGTVIEVHHADETLQLEVGGNTGRIKRPKR